EEGRERGACEVPEDRAGARPLGRGAVGRKDGGAQRVGEPVDLYSRPATRFVAGFIGPPAMNFIEAGIKDGGALWAETSGFRVKIPPDRTDRLKSYAGQPVTVGIRPEDLHPATGSDSSDYTFDAVVDVVEPLGSEILLDVN